MVRLAVLETQLQGRDVALQLQAAEYERRLDQLNHIQRELSKDRMAFLDTKTYDAHHEALTLRVDRLEKWQAKAVGIATAAAVLINFSLRQIIK